MTNMTVGPTSPLHPVAPNELLSRKQPPSPALLLMERDWVFYTKTITIGPGLTAFARFTATSAITSAHNSARAHVLMAMLLSFTHTKAQGLQECVSIPPASKPANVSDESRKLAVVVTL